MSVKANDVVSFKVDASASAYHVDILRFGYYQGKGARIVQTLNGPFPVRAQPACNTDSTTGLVDCGNWSVGFTWTVPATAVSGVYAAHLVRNDNGAGSLVPFVVRDEASHSDIVVQTSDETWQAYNTYGGNSLYSCTIACPPGTPLAYKGAFKVSYNRPFHSAADDSGRSWITYAELPMIMFLEQNGYDVSYLSGNDVSTRGALLLNHKTFMSSGHDEYWSGTQRTNVEAARDHGVNLAFFSGNEVFWKTRWEADPAGTSNRILVAYKDTHFNAPTDPVAWTGAWADPRFSPPGDGGNPQNALTGQFFAVNSGTTDIQVPSQYSNLRLWRNTGVATLAAGQTETLGAGLGTLGYEWDIEPDNGSRPAGLIDLSSTTSSSAEVFNDYGSQTLLNQTATHNLSLYRAPSGALVFGAGTVQWAWGLNNFTTHGAVDNDMQQATVNLLADMGAQPATLDAGLDAAAKSTDTAKPTSTITSPAPGANLTNGTAVTITGTASDVGGVVAGVEVSTDGGTTWHPANGTANWTYSWVVNTGSSANIKSRATDDSGNTETPSAGLSVNGQCPCSLFGSNTPATIDNNDGNAVELGLKFKSDVNGYVTGVRFYKSSANTGTHTGTLWSAAGTQLATVTFPSETASGWQQASFSNPVAVTANTTYVVSYHTDSGHYSSSPSAFYGVPVADKPSLGNSPPLHVIAASGATGGNGLFSYGSSTFPTGSFNATNYWVDATFSTSGPAPTAPGAPGGVTALAGNGSATVTWSAPPNNGSAITSYKVTPFIGTTAQTATTVTGTPPTTSTTVSGLTNGTSYTFTVSATNGVGTGPASSASNAVTPTAAAQTYTIFGANVPTTIDAGDAGANVELGVKFKSDANGFITGVRFYKAGANTGIHTGTLWSSTGTLLATATFTNETASGWQDATFSTPVSVTAGTTYVASYHTTAGHYSYNGQAFASQVDSAPLHALADAASGGNGVYVYGASSFPTQSFNAANYWVDTTFTTTGPSPTAPGAPTGVTAVAANASATVTWSAPANNGSAITSYKVTPFIGTTAQTATTVTGAPPATTATIAGLTNGTSYTFTVSATNSVGTGPVSSASNAVTPTAVSQTYTLFGSTVPSTVDAGDNGASVELGVKFTADISGFISGARFYKAAANTGTHTATLWSSAGSQLATATFANETASGWQSVSFSSPVAVIAGTTYVVSYHTTAGHYSYSGQAFAAQVDNPPLHALSNGASGGNGVYMYGASSFPTQSFNAANYWVDATFTTTGPAPTAPDAPASVSAAAGNASATVTWTAPANNGSAITSYKVTPYIGTTAQTATTVNGTASSTPISGLTNGTSYTFTVSATNGVGTGPASSASNAVTPNAGQTYTLFGSNVPGTLDAGDAGANVELGVKFKSDVSGHITGARFYKSTGNTGAHTATLWSSAGTQLATATFANETASGWQSVTFSTPVAVTAGVTYVISYHTTAGHYSYDGQAFASQVDSGVLHALSSSASGGNGVFAYGNTSFPNGTFNAANYWVDATFSTS